MTFVPIADETTGKNGLSKNKKNPKSKKTKVGQ